MFPSRIWEGKNLHGNTLATVFLCADILAVRLDFTYSGMMSFLTIEVEIADGIVTAKEPHLLPEKGSGLLTVLAEPPNSVRRTRVQLPLVRCQAGTVIDPTKDQLDTSLWDQSP